MTLSIHVILLSVIATSVCLARPSSSHQERQFLTILSPESSFRRLLSSLRESPSSSSSTSSLSSDTSFSDPDSAASLSSLWSDSDDDGDDNDGDGDDVEGKQVSAQSSYSSGSITYPIDRNPSDVTAFDDSDDVMARLPLPLQNGVNRQMMERLKSGILDIFADAQRRANGAEHDVMRNIQAAKRYRPSGFMGSRGKRIIPGLNTLPMLLNKYYQDAAKRKRQPHLGFHGTRG